MNKLIILLLVLLFLSSSTGTTHPVQFSTEVGSNTVTFNFEFTADVDNLEICLKEKGTANCIGKQSFGDYSSGDTLSYTYDATSSTSYTFEVTSNAGSSTSAVVCTKKVSLHFIIDASGSLKRSGFDQERQFVIDLLKRFQDGPDLFSFLLFAQVVYKLSKFTNQTDFSNQLSNAFYLGGQTNLQHPLSVTYTDVFTPENQDPEATKIVVYLTDGRHTTGDDSMISELSNKIFLESGAAIIAIGFVDADVDELRQIAIPDEPLIFDDLDSVELAIDEIVNRICSVESDPYYISFYTTPTTAYINFTINVDMDDFDFCFTSGESECIGQTISGAQAADIFYQLIYERLTADTSYAYAITTTIGSESSTAGGIIKTKEIEESLYFTNLNEDCEYDSSPDLYPTEGYIDSIGCTLYQTVGNYAVISTAWGVTGLPEDDTIESWAFNGEEIVFSNKLTTIEIGGESYQAFSSSSHLGVYLNLDQLESKLFVLVDSEVKYGTYAVVLANEDLEISASSDLYVASLYFTNLIEDCEYDSSPDLYPTEGYIGSIGCTLYQTVGNYAVISAAWGVTGVSEDDTIESWTFNGEEIEFSNELTIIKLGGESYQAFSSSSHLGVYLNLNQLESKLFVLVDSDVKYGTYAVMLANEDFEISASSDLYVGTITVIHIGQPSLEPSVYPTGDRLAYIGESVYGRDGVNVFLKAKKKKVPTATLR